MTCTPHDVIPSIMYIIILYQWHNEPNMGGGGEAINLKQVSWRATPPPPPPHLR